jgi:thymidine kinase
MSSLSFTFGVVMSGKTKQFIQSVKNEKKSVLVMKPDTDFKFKENRIESRNGTFVNADVIISPNMDLYNDICYNNFDKIYIDESQFLTEKHVDQLRRVASDKDKEICCYGIRTDFRNNLFEGSKRLFEVCDSIYEIIVKCNYCENKASHNLKVINGESTSEGEKINSQFLTCEIFFPTCYGCYSRILKEKRL